MDNELSHQKTNIIVNVDKSENPKGPVDNNVSIYKQKLEKTKYRKTIVCCKKNHVRLLMS